MNHVGEPVEPPPHGSSLDWDNRAQAVESIDQQQAVLDKLPRLNNIFRKGSGLVVAAGNEDPLYREGSGGAAVHLF